MDKLTHLSLFSGIGGLDLAAEWAGIETIGQCEWAEYPTKVLEKHWPDMPRWKDIRTLTKESFYERTGARTVDIISGGFPCQPFSVAGKQRSTDDDRYLWPEMVRVVKELRPSWVVGENVAGIVRMALSDILSELEASGYRTRTFLIPACAVGARHRRYRTAIVAYAESVSKRGLCFREETEKPGSGFSGQDVQYPGCPGCKEQHTSGEPEPERPDSGVSDTDNRGGTVRRHRKFPAAEKAGGGGGGHGRRAQEYESGKRRKFKSGMGGVADGISGRMDGYWDTEPDIPRIEKGVPHRAERLKALGNAVVPQQFYPVFAAIVAAENELIGL